jgi:hypothetical protein
MRRLLLALPLVLAFACEKKGGVRDVDAEEVSTWIKANSAVVLDANTGNYRAQNGVLPGAVLLDNYLDWDPPTVLGADKGRQIVFYCAGKT